MVCVVEDDFESQFLGWGLTFGIFISFLPQLYTLVRRKSVEGLSLLSCHINYVSNMGTFLNGCILQSSIFVCCKYSLSGRDCMIGLLPLAQLFAPFFCCYMIVIFYTAYAGLKENPYAPVSLHFPERSDRNVNSHAASLSLIGIKKSKFKKAVDTFLGDSLSHSHAQLFLVLSTVFTIISTLIAFLLAYFLGLSSIDVIMFANVFGVAAAVLQIILYIPQIYTTYQNKTAGSLSVATLLIQIPGSFLVVYYQGIVLHNYWSTWLPYFCSAVQQIILVAQCFYYWVINRRKVYYEPWD